MSALVEILGRFAPGHVLTHDGRDYEFGRIDKAMQAALSVAYFRRAREIVYQLKGEISDAEFDRQLSVVTSEYRRGRYGFPLGEAGSYYLSEGLDELVQRLTGCSPQEAQTLLEERTIETYHVVLCVVAESSPQLKKTLLSQPETGPLSALLQLLCPTRTSNGSPCGSGTPPPRSPAPASGQPPTPG